MKNSHLFSLGLGTIPILLCALLWPQAPSASPVPAMAKAPLTGRASGTERTTSAQQGKERLPASTEGAAPTQATPTNGSQPHDNSFIIGNDDLLAINVWKEPDISRSVPVRSDGMISLPLVGELQAAGQTPLQLEHEIAGKLKSYITDPEVAVIVEQINSQKFNILGQVLRPGAYPLTRDTTVLDAIALAGGFRDFAKQRGIYVLRKSAAPGGSRIPFNFKDVIKGKNADQNIMLQPGDTVVVP